jgi:hypothetical protein
MVAMTAGMTAALMAQRPDAFQLSRDHAAIQYSKGPVDNAVSRLSQALDSGKAQLEFTQPGGYLTSVLRALSIPVDSQVLVFSETSNQAQLINPHNPRAVFFGDRAAVGWVRGGTVLEIAALDPRQGAIFYALDQTPSSRPRLKRNDGCLQCHLSWDTLGVPGIMTISTFPMSDDKNAYATGGVVDDRTAFDQRWGGWYVTGKTVPMRHLGNLPVIRPERELARPAPPAPKIESIQREFDATSYPSRYSDVVALMVLDHQTHVTNLLTRLGWEARVAASERAPGHAAESDRVREAASDLVDALLFVDEAPLPGKVEGSSGFAERFSNEGPKDSKERSLRQLDLTHRLARYRCSYMIYSEAFDALPAEAKAAAYKRLWRVLSGNLADKPYAQLSHADRQAVVEILRETKKDLPAYFQPVTR